MSNITQSPILFSFRISQFSKYDYCPKRVKIEIFKQYEEYPEVTTTGAMMFGTQMHKKYARSRYMATFDRNLLMQKLNLLAVNGAFQKQLDNIALRGIPDDFRVITDLRLKRKVVSIIEVKTTGKRYLNKPELRAAAFQVQLYIWLLKETLQNLGYILHTNHYIEVYSQKNGYLLGRIVVQEDSNIENKIRYIVRSFQGLERLYPPPYSTCKSCSKLVKINCSWNKEMKEQY